MLISDQTPWRDLVDEKAGWDVALETEENVLCAWCNVLDCLVKMEQEAFDLWCEGAQKRAEEFVNNEKLMEVYRRLFELTGSLRQAQ